MSENLNKHFNKIDWEEFHFFNDSFLKKILILSIIWWLLCIGIVLSYGYSWRELLKDLGIFSIILFLSLFIVVIFNYYSKIGKYFQLNPNIIYPFLINALCFIFLLDKTVEKYNLGVKVPNVDGTFDSLIYIIFSMFAFRIFYAIMNGLYNLTKKNSKKS
jgi:hypothetical protein